jgi:hypothetical protein
MVKVAATQAVKVNGGAAASKSENGEQDALVIFPTQKRTGLDGRAFGNLEMPLLDRCNIA